MSKELDNLLDEELKRKEKYSKLLNDPNVTGFTPRGQNEEIPTNNGVMLGGKKKLLKGLEAKKLKTSKDVLEYLKNKKIPLPVNDKIVVYIFEEDEQESIVETDGGMLMVHSDTRSVISRRMGDRDQTEERVWQKGVVVSARESFQSDTGKDIHLEVKVGDVVALGFYAGADLSYDGVKYKVCLQYDLMCKLPE